MKNELDVPDEQARNGAKLEDILDAIRKMEKELTIEVKSLDRRLRKIENRLHIISMKVTP